jgi:hypothetical protein
MSPRGSVVVLNHSDKEQDQKGIPMTMAMSMSLRSLGIRLFLTLEEFQVGPTSQISPFFWISAFGES